MLRIPAHRRQTCKLITCVAEHFELRSAVKNPAWTEVARDPFFFLVKSCADHFESVCYHGHFAPLLFFLHYVNLCFLYFFLFISMLAAVNDIINSAKIKNLESWATTTLTPRTTPIASKKINLYLTAKFAISSETCQRGQAKYAMAAFNSK